MFSNLTQNNVLYLLDLNGNPKVLTGLIENVSLPRPKYNSFNPTMETVVDITANIGGEKRTFKEVPNNSIADFGEAAFLLAENKDVLNSYISSMLQNSKRVVESMGKHQKLITSYEEALEELNPSNKSESKALQEMQNQINTLQEGMKTLLEKLNGNTN